MEQVEHNAKLTSAEMANLWTAYMNDSMAILVIKHFMENIEDNEISKILEYALNLSQRHIDTITVIMTNEEFPVPHGFTEHDLGLTAPRLFTDNFYLTYIMSMANLGTNNYSLALANVAREDIRRFFTECLESSAELINKSVTLLENKGLFIRSPYIPTPKQVEYVHKQSFMTGWFGDRRPLNAVEIMNLFFNIKRNMIGVTLLTAFSQVAKSAEVQDFLVRGKKIASKHLEIFGSLLTENNIPVPTTWDIQPTDSTISPFSDKLLMFHITILIAAGIGYYGTGLGTSQRRDIGTLYIRLTAEILQYAENGANIMINNAWLEQPPTSVDREALVSVKK